MCSVHLHADVIRSDKVVDLRAIRIGSFIAKSSQCKYKCYPGRLKTFDLYGWISLMSQLIIINRALYVNKQQEGKICAIT